MPAWPPLVLADGVRVRRPTRSTATPKRHLPAYARPAFVRIVPEMDVTGTLKQRKRDLAADGYDPTRVTDPLYARDDAAASYRPLTDEVWRAIQGGRLRF